MLLFLLNRKDARNLKKQKKHKQQTKPKTKNKKPDNISDSTSMGPWRGVLLYPYGLLRRGQCIGSRVRLTSRSCAIAPTYLRRRLLKGTHDGSWAAGLILGNVRKWKILGNVGNYWEILERAKGPLYRRESGRAKRGRER